MTSHAPRPPLARNLLFAACACPLLLMAGCGGGGGVVRSDPPSAVAPPPPVQEQCPAPVTADCVPSSANGVVMRGGRQSDYALVARGLVLDLAAGTYRFGGGTSVEGSVLRLQHDAELQSDVKVHADGQLDVAGRIVGNIDNDGEVLIFRTVTGNIENDGRLLLYGTVVGNVANQGLLAIEPYLAQSYPYRIYGDYLQSASGRLVVTIPPDGASAPLYVGGRADLDGTLALTAYTDDWGPYPLPATPLSLHVLHADGGVFGRFAQWESTLFIEGGLRYGGNDVWFDFTRISVQEAMAAAATADALTLASAANLDAALARADAFALASAATLDAGQRRFLASAASLLHSRDIARAVRSLDSLSGHAHASTRDMLHDQAATAAAHFDARLARLPQGMPAGAWSAPLVSGHAGLSMDGETGGFDQWLTPRLLVGGSIGNGRARLAFDRMGGTARGEAPMASVHMHYRGNAWHATGLVGAGRTALQVERPIDLGAAGTHLASSRRTIDQAFLHAGLGRGFDAGRGQLTPFVAVDYTSLRSDGFTEHGDTGFELVAQSARNGQLSATAGARYARDWRFGDSRWLHVDLDVRYQHRIAEDGDPLLAAFAGTPVATFDLLSLSRPPAGAGLVNLGLRGGLGNRWSWSLDYARRLDGEAQHDHGFVGLRREL